MKVKINASKLKLGEIAEMCGGKLVLRGADENTEIGYMCTDSREADAETLFAAIRGEKTDGNEYIGKAVAGGCRAILGETIPDETVTDDFGMVVVPDTVNALGKIASEYKKRFDCLTVGITGSVGKTTTKEFVASVLERKFRTYKTEGNHNSVIGMPLSVTEMPRDTEAAVFEMGMSGFGEISLMSKAARPNIGIITTIGSSHIELLGTRENILKAKTEIIDGMAEDGILLLSGDDPLLIGADKRGRKCLYVAIDNRDADFRALNIRTEISKTTFDVLYDEKIYSNIEIPIMGQHNVYAALFAFAVGMLSGMTADEIRSGLSAFRSPGMRQHIYDVSGITIIEDCYNASPESMRSAIDVLAELSAKKSARPVALLGDMLELGERSPAMHAEIGEYLARKGCKVLFTYGKLAENIASSAAGNGMNPENIYVNRDKENRRTTEDMLMHALKKGDVLLLKASRGMAVEHFAEYIKNNPKF